MYLGGIYIYTYSMYYNSMYIYIIHEKKWLHKMPFQHTTALQTNLLRWQILPICCKYRKTKKLPNSTRNDEDKYGSFMIIFDANSDVFSWWVHEQTQTHQWLQALIICNKCLSFKNNLSPKVMLWEKNNITKSSNHRVSQMVASFRHGAWKCVLYRKPLRSSIGLYLYIHKGSM